jgi:sulfate adenylyltransferase
VTLDVSESFAEKVDPGRDIALRDQEGVILAILSVTDKWTPDKAREAEGVFGANDLAHPTVNYLHHTAGKVYLGGPVTGIQPPVHYDFRARRDTPNELRALFRKLGWTRVVAFQTRNPLHRAHQELTFRAAREAQANLLIHPVVGMTKPGDVDHFTRVRCYEAVLDKYPASTTHLSLLNLAMRMGGPREALWHAIIRRNHGLTHFIVGRDHAGVGKYYGTYDAQRIFDEFTPEEIGITPLYFENTFYCRKCGGIVSAKTCPHDKENWLSLSGTQVRQMLEKGEPLPLEFTRPEISQVLIEGLRRHKG